MSGNRDFLIANKFLKQANITKLADPTVITLHGIPTLLTHGDKLCTQDIAYQRYRRIAQHPITRFLFLCLPKRTRENIGRKLRKKSQAYQQTQNIKILDVSESTVEEYFIQYNTPQMIHGHVHRPNIHDHAILDKQTKRFVLGDWHTMGSVIISTPEQTALAVFDPIQGIQIKNGVFQKP